jgi:formylmethanofuran dehydrogenase subunit E
MTVNKTDRNKRAKKKYHCELCGEELEEDEVYELDGMILYFDCHNEEEDIMPIR